MQLCYCDIFSATAYGIYRYDDVSCHHSRLPFSFVNVFWSAIRAYDSFFCIRCPADFSDRSPGDADSVGIQKTNGLYDMAQII